MFVSQNMELIFNLADGKISTVSEECILKLNPILLNYLEREDNRDRVYISMFKLSVSMQTRRLV